MFSLDGRVALVTGGSSGIGRAIAAGFAKAAASVLVVARMEPALTEAVHAITDAGGRGAQVSVDLADRAALTDTAERATTCVHRLARSRSGIQARQCEGTI